MDQAAVDAALKRVRAAYALDYAVADLLAGILHLFYAGDEGYVETGPGGGVMKLKLEGRGFVANAPSHFALAADYAVDIRAHGEEDFILADQILGEHRMDGVANFGSIGGDR